MRIKDKLCMKAVELENEIEFRIAAKLSARNEKKMLKKILTTLEDLSDNPDTMTRYKAKELVETCDAWTIIMKVLK